GRGDFQRSVSRFGADYNGIISAAKGAGYAGAGTFNLTNTFSATPLAFASFAYAIVTTYAGGEIRSPRRTMLRALLLSLGIASVIVLVMMGLAARTFGHDFLGSATYLANVAPDKYTLPAAPSYFFFSSMLTTSTF